MSESNSGYLSDHDVLCSICRAPIGRVVLYNGRPQLHVGTLYLANADGWCEVCGCEYHYQTGGEHLRRVMEARERVKEMVRG